MILLAILTVWLVLITFAVVLCRIAAVADERQDDATQRYPTISVKRLRGGEEHRRVALGEKRFATTQAPAPPQEEEEEELASGSLSRARGGRGRAGRYAA